MYGCFGTRHALAPLVAKLLCLCIALPLASVVCIRLHVGMRCSVSSAVPLSPQVAKLYLVKMGGFEFILCDMTIYSKFSLE